VEASGGDFSDDKGAGDMAASIAIKMLTMWGRKGFLRNLIQAGCSMASADLLVNSCGSQGECIDLIEMCLGYYQVR
jgi:hypothetical protein